jgi:hypothetical protein
MTALLVFGIAIVLYAAAMFVGISWLLRRMGTDRERVLGQSYEQVKGNE